MEKIGVKIQYPDDTKGLQNQRGVIRKNGQIMIQIAVQTSFIDFKQLQTKTDR